ncbi:hypothetical protein G6F65_020071 [Rhizopus arrhizus]|nr:hypothetical protein G6F65_020071 [Rhizopus arrhizus]
MDLRLRVKRRQHVAPGLGLGAANAGGGVEDLALQVAELDYVVVSQGDVAHTGAVFPALRFPARRAGCGGRSAAVARRSFVLAGLDSGRRDLHAGGRAAAGLGVSLGLRAGRTLLHRLAGQHVQRLLQLEVVLAAEFEHLGRNVDVVLIRIGLHFVRRARVGQVALQVGFARQAEQVAVGRIGNDVVRFDTRGLDGTAVGR